MLSRTDYRLAYQRLRAKLRAARREAELTQAQVARTLGKPQSYVSKLEIGERRLDFVELQILAQVYQKSVSYFEDEALLPGV